MVWQQLHDGLFGDIPCENSSENANESATGSCEDNITDRNCNHESNVTSQGNAGCSNVNDEDSIPEENNDTGEGNTVNEGGECDKLKEDLQGVFVDMSKHLDDNQAE